jgi:nucleoid DNA-binding protein
MLKKGYKRGRVGFIDDEEGIKNFHVMLVNKYMEEYNIQDKTAANAMLASVFLTMVELINTYGFCYARGLGTFIAATTKRAKVRLIDGTEVEVPLVKRVTYRCSKSLHQRLNDECKSIIADLMAKKKEINDEFDVKKAAFHVKTYYKHQNGLDELEK